MRRHPRALLVVLALAWAAAAGTPAAADATGTPFAALTVTPHGAQRYDISTGVTTLPDGGTVVDQDTGVRLDAAHLSYLEGVRIDARGVSVSGAFGTLTADSVHIDVKRGVLTASGHLALTRQGLRVSAAKLTYDANSKVADFGGPVTGTSPNFTAGRLLLDADSGNVLLLGDYRYDSGPFTLQAPKGGGRLELRLHQVDGAPVYDASTQISPQLLARFAAELE